MGTTARFRTFLALILVFASLKTLVPISAILSNNVNYSWNDEDSDEDADEDDPQDDTDEREEKDRLGIEKEFLAIFCLNDLNLVTSREWTISESLQPARPILEIQVPPPKTV